VAVALADKIDTLTGFWAIDEKPTGSKDPYALRRAALGVIRLVLDSKASIPLQSTITVAAKLLASDWLRSRFFLLEANTVIGFENDEAPGILSTPDNYSCTEELAKRMLIERHVVMLSAGGAAYEKDITGYVDEFDSSRHVRISFSGKVEELGTFFHDRLKVHLRDQGIRHDVIDACLSMPGNDDLTLLVKRAEALSAFLKTDDGENLVQGFRRANNLLTQAEEKDGVEYSFGPDPKLADTPEETALFAALDAAESAIAPAMQSEDFAAAMAAMARLRAPIDAFFEAVQINAQNEILRRNRLNLLHRIRAACLQVADLTRLEG